MGGKQHLVGTPHRLPNSICHGGDQCGRTVRKAAWKRYRRLRENGTLQAYVSRIPPPHGRRAAHRADGRATGAHVTGPRATGKTTTARRHAASVVRLDLSREAAALRADPDSALAGFDEPILLDEWQLAPGVLGAVKRAVDDDPRPGRFLLTGSVRADLKAETSPGTGRVVRLPMHGMTVSELRRAAGIPFLDRVAASDLQLPPDGDRPDLRGYVEIALRSGFPEGALKLSFPPRCEHAGSRATSSNS